MHQHLIPVRRRWYENPFALALLAFVSGFATAMAVFL